MNRRATVAHQAPLSMGFSRQENWSGLIFPTPGDLPNPGIEPMSLASSALAGGLFTTEPPEKPCLNLKMVTAAMKLKDTCCLEEKV